MGLLDRILLGVVNIVLVDLAAVLVSPRVIGFEAIQQSKKHLLQHIGVEEFHMPSKNNATRLLHQAVLFAVCNDILDV